MAMLLFVVVPYKVIPMIFVCVAKSSRNTMFGFVRSTWPSRPGVCTVSTGLNWKLKIRASAPPTETYNPTVHFLYCLWWLIGFLGEDRPKENLCQIWCLYHTVNDSFTNLVECLPHGYLTHITWNFATWPFQWCHLLDAVTDSSASISHPLKSKMWSKMLCREGGGSL